MRDQLLLQSNANPIYSSAFVEYYQEYFNSIPSKNLEFVALDGETPVLLFLLQEFTSIETNSQEYSYFGLPGLVALNRKCSYEIHKLAIDHASTQLDKLGFSTSLLNTSFEINFPDLPPRESKLIEKIASASSSAFVFFERVIDLRKSNNDLVSDFSKSVKSAMKQDVSKEVTFNFVTHDSPLSVRRNAIRELKELHFLSSGRKTRSEKSWELQEIQLANGCLAIGMGHKNDMMIHGAMYMVSNSSAFYAVSANSREIRGTSIAHPFIAKSIFALKELGIEKVYMGRQYEELTREITEKERNIAKFKSFFGGELVIGLGLSNA